MRFRHWPYRHRHPHAAILFVNEFAILLKPDDEAFLMTNITLGHGVTLAIIYLDANGNPMLTVPTVDSAPVWTQTTPATESLTVAPDGLTASTQSLAVGSDRLGLTAIVSGVTFTAFLTVNVDAAPQVLTSIQIQATVV